MPSNNKLYFEIYTSVLTAKRIYVKGRLLSYSPPVSKVFTGYISSLFHSFRRALSREIAYTDLIVTTSFETYLTRTDNEGYFTLDQALEHDNINDLKIKYSLSNGAEGKTSKSVFTYYKHHMPKGIISDIDDTVLVTGVKSFFKIKVILNTLFLNPFRRKPIEHAAEYYRIQLAHREGNGPIIYISNSPWNLHAYLSTFLYYNNFPEGELLLRDFGLHMLRKKKALRLQNKFLLIEKVLQLFPDTQFTLIGDSAEKDFDIYSAINQQYKNQVDEVIIIKAKNKKNEQKIERKISEENFSNFKIVDSYKEILDRIIDE